MLVYNQHNEGITITSLGTPLYLHYGGYKLLERSDNMNQDDMILLGELMDTLGDHYLKDEKFADVIQKTMIISKQAKASKEYQELMDKLNNDLSDIGKNEENGKN